MSSSAIDQPPTIQIEDLPSLLKCISQVGSSIRSLKTSRDEVKRSQSYSEGSHNDSSSRSNKKNPKRPEKKGNKNNMETNLRRTETDAEDIPPLDGNLHLSNEIEKLHRDLSYIKDALDKLNKMEDSIRELMNTLIQRSKNILGDFSQAPEGPGLTVSSKDLQKIQGQLSELSEIVMKLKLHIPSNSLKFSSSTSDAHKYEQVIDEFTANNSLDELPKLEETDGEFLFHSVYKDFRSSYEQLLDTREKLCCLCFAVFPEGAVIKRRFMHYWWVGEGFIDPDSEAEDTSGNILNKFVETGFIHPVVKEHKAVTKSKSFKMLPLIRKMVVILAQEAKFFDFNHMGYPTAKSSESLRCCLTGSKERSLKEVKDQELRDLHTLFNVNESYLDLEEESFSKMENINVLSLGSWKGRQEKHIEVTKTEFLQGVKYMKHLKFFSLNGISRINELPNSIGELHNLQIMDLKACHNLESLPDEIRSLQELRNLDVSGCYLLESMPKGLNSLSKLEVLMGFVVSDVKRGSTCTLKDLVKLKNLRELGISTSSESFPAEDELTTLQKFKKLKKLTIAWGKCFSAISSGAGAESLAKDGKSLPEEESTTLQKFKKLIPCGGKSLSTTSTGKGAEPSGMTSSKKSRLPELQKLELVCYPLKAQPTWLTPSAFPKLETLHIRGGNLHRLERAQEDNQEWGVKSLHLKFLNELAMDWRQLRKSFPRLVCLQKINCPKLTLMPCNEDGVWLEEWFLQSHQERLNL